MSNKFAHVYSEGYSWYCAYCDEEGEENFDSESMAESHAEAHDKEVHSDG